MHATYCFLHQEDEFGLDWENQSLGFDENNWYQELATINSQGEIEEHCSNNDWRGRHGFQERLAEIPKEDRWKEAVTLSEAIFKYELVDTLRLLRGFDYEIPEDPDYEYLETEIREALAEKADTLDPFYIKKAAVALSGLRDRTGPFTYDFDNPYISLRTFAFNGVKLEDENATITFVDIHT